MRATQHTTRGPLYLLEHRNGFADIVERRAVVLAEHPPVIRPHTETEFNFITFSENASRYGYRFSKQCLGFSEAP